MGEERPERAAPAKAWPTTTFPGAPSSPCPSAPGWPPPPARPAPRCPSSNPTSPSKTPDGQLRDAAFIPPGRAGPHPGRALHLQARRLRPAPGHARSIGGAKPAPARASRCSCPIPSTASPGRRSTRRRRIVDFSAPETRAKLGPLMGSIRRAGRRRDRDAAVYVAFLDAQPQVDKAQKIGTQGYCMGGRARDADRRRAAGPDRRRRVVPRRRAGHRQARQPAPAGAAGSKARMYIGVASNDDAAPARREGQAAARPSPPAKVPRRDRGLSGAPRLVRADMPTEAGTPIYSPADALPSAPGASCSPSTGRRSACSRSAPVTASSLRRAEAQLLRAALGRQQAGDLRRGRARSTEPRSRLVPGRASTLINLAAVQLPLARPADALAERRCSARGRARQRRCLASSRHRAAPSSAAPEEALAAFERLLAIDPRHAAAWSAERQPAARDASARRGRARVSRGAAPWRRRGSARVLPRLGRGRRRARDRAAPPTSPASSTAMPTSSTAPRRRAALPGAPPAGRSAGRDLRRPAAPPLGARPGLRDRAVRPAGAADGRRG